MGFQIKIIRATEFENTNLCVLDGQLLSGKIRNGNDAYIVDHPEMKLIKIKYVAISTPSKENDYTISFNIEKPTVPLKSLEGKILSNGTV